MASVNTRLLGALRKTVLPAGGGGRGCWDERMDETHLSMFISVSKLLALMEIARETVSLPRLGTLFIVGFFLFCFFVSS